MVAKRLRKGILSRQYPSKAEAKRLSIEKKPVRLDSKTIKKLRNGKMTIKQFKRRFGIK